MGSTMCTLRSHHLLQLNWGFHCSIQCTASLCIWDIPGVIEETAFILAEMDLKWCDGGLYVNQRVGPMTPELQGKVGACIVELMAFKKFTDSRWVSVGRTCKSLVGS